MSETNPGYLAHRTELPANRAQFGCAQTVLTNAEQFVPPGGGGTTTSTTVNTWGIYVTSDTFTITEYAVEYTGDAGNNAGQTMTPNLYYRRGGSATLIPGSTGSAIDTNAGRKSTSKTLTTPFTAQKGDVIVASLTPSAGLSNALVGVMIALG